MSESGGNPVDVWKRLKKLTKERKKIVERLKRVNESISIRSRKLNEIGDRYGQLTFAIERLREELSEDQIKMITKLLEMLTVRVESLTNDISELSEPNILLFAELEDVEAEITALQSIIDAEAPKQKKEAQETEIESES